MYKAIRTSVLSVEPGKVVKIFPNKNISVETEPVNAIKEVDRTRNCVVLSLDSGPNSTITEHALSKKASVELLLDLIGALSTMGEPISSTLRDSLPRSIDDIPMEYREWN
jgi:hypothetical protein